MQDVSTRRDGEQRLQLVEIKTDAGRRTIAVPQFAMEPLAVRLQEATTPSRPRHVQGFVFTTPRGTPHDPRNVNRRFGRLMALADLPEDVRLHDIRHTSASMMLAQGYTLDDVKRVLGHSSIQVTVDTYGHLVAGRGRELADGMNRLLGGGA